MINYKYISRRDEATQMICDNKQACTHKICPPKQCNAKAVRLKKEQIYVQENRLETQLFNVYIYVSMMDNTTIYENNKEIRPVWSNAQ